MWQSRPQSMKILHSTSIQGHLGWWLAPLWILIICQLSQLSGWKAPLGEDSSPEPLVNLFLAKFSDFVNTTVAWVGNIWFSSTLHWYFSLKMKQYPYELGKWGFCSDWILGLVPSFLYETTHKFLTKGERHEILWVWVALTAWGVVSWNFCIIDDFQWEILEFLANSFEKWGWKLLWIIKT